MKNLIIEGKTGSGKTYHAVKRAREIGRFAYVAPCRLLAYETFIKYYCSGCELGTGAVHIEGNRYGDWFGTYHALENDEVKEYDTLIIDEAHWLSNLDMHSKKIAELMLAAEEAGINVFLVTATRNFEKIQRYEIIKLQSIVKFQRQNISVNEALEREANGAKTLIIASSIKQAEEWQDDENRAIITRQYPEHHILDSILKFQKGEIISLISTNIAAQGINLPCENLIIETNDYDGVTDVKQKAGRLGRYGITNQDSVLTYSFYFSADKKIAKQKIKKRKLPDIKEIAALDEKSGYTPEKCDRTKEIILRELAA